MCVCMCVAIIFEMILSFCVKIKKNVYELVALSLSLNRFICRHPANFSHFPFFSIFFCLASCVRFFQRVWKVLWYDQTALFQAHKHALIRHLHTYVAPDNMSFWVISPVSKINSHNVKKNLIPRELNFSDTINERWSKEKRTWKKTRGLERHA